MAEYQGKKVTLNKPRALRKGEPGYGKKRKVVFVGQCSSGGNKVKRITFGDANLGMHKNKDRKSVVQGKKGLGLLIGRNIHSRKNITRTTPETRGTYRCSKNWWCSRLGRVSKNSW